MEYVQMTLDDWVNMKNELKQDIMSAKDKINGLKKDFVRIGFKLRQIEDGKLYEKDGYKSTAEFAKAECELSGSDVTRFMQINKRYSVDGYSKELRPEFLKYGKSKLADMLALPDTDLQMIEPAASRETIRELGRFNKAEPAAGVADDIHQLIEKFYQDNPDILNKAFSETDILEEQNIKRFVEIVNPAGNRSYKKGLFFLMMYENRVAVKKFGDTPQDMTWREFYQITMDIFEDAAAGPKTWQRYFGGEDDEGTENGPARDGEIHGADNSGAGPDEDVPGNDAKPADEDGRGGEDNSGSSSGNGADNIQPISADEDDGGADGENGIEDEPENQKGVMGDYGEVSKTGAGKAEDDTAGEESGKSDCQEPAARETAEPAGAESQREEIAPAQKSAEILEREDPDEVKNGENHGAAEGETSEPETEEAAGEETKETESCFEAINQPEQVEVEEVLLAEEQQDAQEGKDAEFVQTRKEYLDECTEYGAALYLNRHLSQEILKNTDALERWLKETVDINGREIEEADE